MLHSFDRITSLFIHALAPLTLHVIRFSSSTSSLALQSSSSSLWPVTSQAPRCYIRHYSFVGYVNKRMKSYFAFIDFNCLHCCGFLDVSSNCLPERMHNHTGCICLIFHHCGFSNVSSKHLHQRMHSHIGYIYLTFLLCVFSNVP